MNKKKEEETRIASVEIKYEGSSYHWIGLNNVRLENRVFSLSKIKREIEREIDLLLQKDHLTCLENPHIDFNTTEEIRLHHELIDKGMSEHEIAVKWEDLKRTI